MNDVKIKTIECKHCGTEYDSQEDYDDEVRETLDGELRCGGCFESAWEYPSNVLKAGPDGRQEYQFTGEYGDLEGELPEPISKEKWVSTDPWRGYIDWELKPGFVELTSGWVTGWPDEATKRKKELSVYFDKIRLGILVPPVEIWWLFGRTSNVFSTGSTIVCRSSEVEIVKEWLNEINGGVEHFNELLS